MLADFNELHETASRIVQHVHITRFRSVCVCKCIQIFVVPFIQIGINSIFRLRNKFNNYIYIYSYVYLGVSLCVCVVYALLVSIRLLIF